MKGLLILNGEKSDALPLRSDYDFCVVVDGAYEKAKEKIKDISCVIGDFDSLGYVPVDEKTIRLSCEKDFTDGEVALSYLIERGCDEIDVVWALGLRIDHMLGNIGLLQAALEKGARARIISSSEMIYLVDKELRLQNVFGKTISLLPFFAYAHIIYGEGFKYDPTDLILKKSETRGISNVATANEIFLKVKEGSLLVVVNETER